VEWHCHLNTVAFQYVVSTLILFHPGDYLRGSDDLFQTSSEGAVLEDRVRSIIHSVKEGGMVGLVRTFLLLHL